MKTIYFLGAGASKGSDFGLPVMNEFFRKFDPNEFPVLAEYLTKVFPGHQFDELNLEEVITHMELSLEGFGALWMPPEPELAKARQEYDEYCRKRLDHTGSPSSKILYSHEGTICRIHRELFEDLCPEDSVITLNYDLVCDFALPRSENSNDKGILGRSNLLIERSSFWGGTPASVPRQVKEKGLYLKLHGSLNWIYCSNRNCLHHQYFFSYPIDTVPAWNQDHGPCYLCGSGLVSVIIPPAMKKSFEKFPKMGLIWNIAYRELKAADRWVIIGASFPESDYYLRWLLKEAHRHRPQPPEVTIVNPDPKVCDTMHKILGISEPKAYWAGLKDFVDGQE